MFITAAWSRDGSSHVIQLTMVAQATLRRGAGASWCVVQMHNAGIRPKTNAGVVSTGQRLGRWVAGVAQSEPMASPSEPVTVLYTPPAASEPVSRKPLAAAEPVPMSWLKKLRTSVKVCSIM